MVLRLFFILCCTLPLSAQNNWLAAPNLTPSPINQLRASGNACGPACLLDAFQCGSEKWSDSAKAIKGESERSRLIKIIQSYGARPSKLIPTRRRWDQRGGVNAEDLTAMANEMRTRSWMGTVKQEILFKGSRETPAKLLQRSHTKLRKSLKKGLPPIMSIRRVALAASRDQTSPLGSPSNATTSSLLVSLNPSQKMPTLSPSPTGTPGEEDHSPAP